MDKQLDDVLTHIGTGSWSILHFIAMSYSSLFLPTFTLGGAFSAPRLDFSCHAPDDELPATNLSLLQKNSSSLTLDGECQYIASTPEGPKTMDCTEFLFDNSTFSSTLTSEYNLACDRAYLQTSFQSLYMLGIFTGASITGFLSDKYGRKRTIAIGLVMYLSLAMISTWMPHLASILVTRFLCGCCHASITYIPFVLMVEVLEPKMRVAAGFGIYNVWVLGMIMYGAVGYLIRDWRVLQTVLILPGLLTFPLLWFVDESPRWLIVNGHPKEALRVLQRAARWHGVDLPSEDEMKVVLEGQDLKRETLEESSVWSSIRSLIREIMVLFRTRRLRTITLCVYLNFAVAGMVYFGLSLSGGAISSDPFVYMVLTAIMEVPAYTLTIPLVNRLGRKFPLAFFFLTSAGVLFTLPFIPKENSTITICLAMLGKMVITGGFQTIVFFSSELFPTEVRSRGINTSYMASRVGGMVSPYINDLVGTVYPWAPFVVFGVGGLLAGGAALLLPETKGRVLSDTVAHLEGDTT